MIRLWDDEVAYDLGVLEGMEWVIPDYIQLLLIIDLVGVGFKD